MPCRSAFHACLDERRGCHCPRCCINGIRYRPWLSLMPMRMGLPLHVMSTSSSLCTVTPSLVKIDMVPSSESLPTLMSDVGKSSNVSALLALGLRPLNGRLVTCFAWLHSPLATATRLVDLFKIGRLALHLSFSLI